MRKVHDKRVMCSTKPLRTKTTPVFTHGSLIYPRPLFHADSPGWWPVARKRRRRICCWRRVHHSWHHARHRPRHTRHTRHTSKHATRHCHARHCCAHHMLLLHHWERVWHHGGCCHCLHHQTLPLRGSLLTRHAANCTALYCTYLTLEN